MRVCRSRRVLVLGCCGSGKSFLSRRLAGVLGLPLIHMDDIYWGPDWTRPEPAVWQERLGRLVGAEEWIIDGNYFSSLALRLPRAELAVMLDLPTWRCLSSVVWRDLTRLGNTEDLPAQVRAGAHQPRTSPGRLDFWRQVARFNRVTREPMLRMLEDSGVPRVLLRSRQEAQGWVESVRRARTSTRLAAGTVPVDTSPPPMTGQGTQT